MELQSDDWEITQFSAFTDHFDQSSINLENIKQHYSTVSFKANFKKFISNKYMYRHCACGAVLDAIFNFLKYQEFSLTDKNWVVEIAKRYILGELRDDDSENIKRISYKYL